MNLRTASRLAALVFSVGAMACADDGYEVTDLSTRLEVSPLYKGVRFGDAPVQFNATVGGDPVAVTWESSDPAVATVSPTGLATPVDGGGGFVAITATLVSNPAKQRSASFTINPLYAAMTSGVPRTNIAGDVGDTLYYRINVPAGATNLTWTLSGGTGDFDLYVAYNRVPNYGAANWDCRPYAIGNNETCPFTNPAAGFWYAWLDVYENASGASLVATVTAP
jgi:hypothetical protein